MAPINLGNEELPDIPIEDAQDELMLKTLTALIILTGISIYAIGLPAFYHTLIAVITVLGIHYIIFFIQRLQDKEPTYSTPYSPLVAAMIVGLTVPSPTPPYEVTAGIAALTILIFKYAQGHFFGRKYVNPAAAARTLLLILLSVGASLGAGMMFHPCHLRVDMFSAEAFYEDVVNFYSTEDLTALQSLFLWKTHGWLGGISGVSVLIIGIGLTFWAKLKWRIILSYLLCMTFLAVATGFITGGYVLLRIAFHVFTGSVIFLAFFMATDPPTTPMTDVGEYLFGVSLGVLTFGLQLFNVLGGSIIALLALNILSNRLDRVILQEKKM